MEEEKIKEFIERQIEIGEEYLKLKCHFEGVEVQEFIDDWKKALEIIERESE